MDFGDMRKMHKEVSWPEQAFQIYCDLRYYAGIHCGPETFSTIRARMNKELSWPEQAFQISCDLRYYGRIHSGPFSSMRAHWYEADPTSLNGFVCAAQWSRSALCQYLFLGQCQRRVLLCEVTGPISGNFALWCSFCLAELKRRVCIALLLALLWPYEVTTRSTFDETTSKNLSLHLPHFSVNCGSCSYLRVWLRIWT